MPRPPISEPRPVRCTIRLTPEEAAALTRAALASGQSRSAYLRQIFRKATPGAPQQRGGRRSSQTRRHAHNLALLAGPLAAVRQLTVELIRQGNNLNQIAHRLNAYETVDSAHLRRLVLDTRERVLSPVVAELRKGLNRLAGIE